MWSTRERKHLLRTGSLPTRALLRQCRWQRQDLRPRTKWLGVALMLYPYAAPGVWVLYAVGVALCVAVYWDRV